VADEVFREERTISGKRYRVILEPFGPEAPLGPAVFTEILKNNQWLLIHEHQQLSCETNEQVIAMAWAVAEKHARL
jgi:hypothetical protein